MEKEEARKEETQEASKQASKMCAGPPVKVHAHHCIHFRWSPPVKVKAHHSLNTKAVKAHQKDNGRQSGERIR